MIRKWLKQIGIIFFCAIALIMLFNASFWVAADPDARAKIISHRGVHQTYHRQDLTNETCTAERIDPVTHSYLENTLPSAQAAFAYGADIVEIDIHLTTDKQFAVFHDWTLDCRTNGSGVTREHTLATLQALDIAYGYTPDGGETFPFRGQTDARMPELSQMLALDGTKQFLINFKSRDRTEGDLLADFIAQNPWALEKIWSVYGGQEPTDRSNHLIEGLNGFGSKSARKCIISYVLLGWSGHFPQSCQNTKIMVPINLAHLFWGWPTLFEARAKDHGSEVILIGPVSWDETGTTGIDSLEMLEHVPDAFDGYIWTNKIELIGPALRAN